VTKVTTWVWEERVERMKAILVDYFMKASRQLLKDVVVFINQRQLD
jgi:hypothetical protein